MIPVRGKMGHVRGKRDEGKVLRPAVRCGTNELRGTGNEERRRLKGS
jgi:hypothetical protein